MFIVNNFKRARSLDKSGGPTETSRYDSIGRSHWRVRLILVQLCKFQNGHHRRDMCARGARLAEGVIWLVSAGLLETDPIRGAATQGIVLRRQRISTMAQGVFFSMVPVGVQAC
jgi:hypothetical protein